MQRVLSGGQEQWFRAAGSTIDGLSIPSIRAGLDPAFESDFGSLAATLESYFGIGVRSVIYEPVVGGSKLYYSLLEWCVHFATTDVRGSVGDGGNVSARKRTI